MIGALVAPVVRLLAALLLVAQRAAEGFADLLDAYDRRATALGPAVLRVGHRLVDRPGPLGRFLRALAAPVWRRVTASWRWLDVQIVHADVPAAVGRLRQTAARLEPVLLRLTQGVEAVERAAARLAAGRRRLCARPRDRAAVATRVRGGRSARQQHGRSGWTPPAA